MAVPWPPASHTRANNLESPDFFLSLPLVLQFTFFRTVQSQVTAAFELFFILQMNTSSCCMTPAGLSDEQDHVTASTYSVVEVQSALAWPKVKLVAKTCSCCQKRSISVISMKLLLLVFMKDQKKSFNSEGFPFPFALTLETTHFLKKGLLFLGTTFLASPNSPDFLICSPSNDFSHWYRNLSTSGI